MRVISTGWQLCDNCHCLIGSGVVTNADHRDITAEHAARMDAWDLDFANGEAWVSVCTAETGDCGFSYAQCDGCGETDGGTRHPYNVIGPDRPE